MVGTSAGKLSMAVVAATALALAVAASPSAAGSDAAFKSYPQITVPSQYDPSTTISAPVRHLPQGDQVRLPGGAWVWCEINCFHTLRNATIDFWRRYDAPPQ
jgi:hypothetical protein